jgi:hypothetical protein
MTIADLHVVPSRWIWLASTYAMRVLLTVFLLVGLLTFAAVLTIGLQLDCHDEATVLTTEAGVPLMTEDGRFLVTGQKHKRCWLADNVPW